MKRIMLTLDYYTLDELIQLIDQPYRSIVEHILRDHRPLFEKSRGSTHNHQTWEGGYIDHVTDGMNYMRHMYTLLGGIGRPLPFSLSDALLIFFLHDLEKPWRIYLDEHGAAHNRKGLDTKAAFKQFREDKLAEYGLELTPALQNALTYVEGELADYSSTHRVMNELAAFCHMVDVWSARGAYQYPMEALDEWGGATRYRTT